MAALDEPSEDAIAVRKRRVRFRCWHRGTKELDLLMGPFADRHVADMTPAQLDQMEDLLNTPDLDLYNWITRREPVPPCVDGEVLQLIIEFHNGL